MLKRGLEPNAHPSDEPELEDDAILELDPEVLASMIAAEVKAFYKSRGNSGSKKPTAWGRPTCRSETSREWRPWGGSRWRAGSWPGRGSLVS